MIVKLQVLYDDLNPHGGRGRDEIIRAVDGVLEGFVWEQDGKKTNSWIARV
jgi:hypothetical protein